MEHPADAEPPTAEPPAAQPAADLAPRARVDDTLIAELDGRFRGRILLPGDDGYDSARRVWNGMIDRRPALILRCAGTADVISALWLVRESGLPVAVRGGGHSLPGFSAIDGGVVLDLSDLRGLHVDVAGATARAQPGVTWGQFDHETQAFGLATTGGTVSHTGIAGLTLGGGIGLLMRKCGLTCDNLIGAEVVTADGTLVRADAGHNAELLWGLRGAGANFGVVTSFEYTLHRVGPQVMAGVLVHPLDQALDVLPAYRDFAQDAPDDFSSLASLVSIPDEEWAPPPIRGRKALAVAGCYAGSVEEGERFVAPLRAIGKPALDLFGPDRYVEVQRSGDFGFPWGRQYYFKAAYLGGLPAAALEALVERFEQAPSPFTQVDLHQMGGAVARADEQSSAFWGRHAAYVANVASGWEDPEATEQNVGWTRELVSALESWTLPGSYVNMTTDADTDAVRRIYGDERYRRLVALKDHYDPANLFRHNHNVRPSNAA
ncbi:MAG TPA: FAD-binding oxidoreductase [Actinocrinis sp.]|uniref:FAD-binding oxidoreductase n=1 Tax=Actinocrinis sp. TaxID=1920516 RepID=UPI002DDD4B5F|nr:FAD-binding oxidoreductase [Actinocrinis sp.]HEV2344905.1 FAD-binding oxidoreductase [Actinocrinis sp.]